MCNSCNDPGCSAQATLDCSTAQKLRPSDSGITYRKPIGIRFDLIPPAALRRLAAIYEEGARVYGPSTYVFSNIPMSNVINHMYNHLTLYEIGDRDEDHLAKCAWAFMTLMTLERERPGANDVCSYGVRSAAEPPNGVHKSMEPEREE